MGHINRLEVGLEGEDGSGHPCSTPTSATHSLFITYLISTESDCVSDFCTVINDLWD